MCDYSYQKKIAKELFKSSESSELFTVLGASPGSGKTSILIHFLNKYFSATKDAKVVLIPSNRLSLMEQIYEALEDGPVKPTFSFSRITDDIDTQLTLSLPKTLLTRIKKGFSYNALVVDEAHLLVPTALLKPCEKSMMGKILTTYKLRMGVGMTGSPYFFSAYPNNFNILYYSAAEIEKMAGHDLFNGMDIHIFRGKEKEILARLRETFKYIKMNKVNRDKIIFFSKNQKEAISINSYLKNHFRMNSAVSTSLTDPDGEMIREFKRGKYECLVVVGRLREGFSDHSVTLSIDFACTLSEILCQQQLCRLNRWLPSVDKKNYIRVLRKSSKTYVSDHVEFFRRVVKLFSKEGYENFKIKLIS